MTVKEFFRLFIARLPRVATLATSPTPVIGSMAAEYDFGNEA